jgi:methylated-DNA-[protein]-cysteine S-methyltransferase
MDTRHALVDTSLGAVILVASGEALIGVYFSGPRGDTDGALLGDAVPAESDDVFSAAKNQLGEFLDGSRTTFDLRTETHGETFQERIWSLISEIPVGQTTTAKELAQRYASRYLAKDIGDAIASNPLAVIVPSHRVVGHDRNIGGYVGGVDRKRALLEIEGNRWSGRGRRSDPRYLTLGREPDEVGVA